MNELLTVMEMAEFLRISRSKAYNMTRQESFPKIKIDKSIRIIKSELLKWLQNNEKVI